MSKDDDFQQSRIVLATSKQRTIISQTNKNSKKKTFKQKRISVDCTKSISITSSSIKKIELVKCPICNDDIEISKSQTHVNECLDKNLEMNGNEENDIVDSIVQNEQEEDDIEIIEIKENCSEVITQSKPSMSEQWKALFRTAKVRAGLTFGYGFETSKSSSSSTSTLPPQNKLEPAAKPTLKASDKIAAPKKPTIPCPFYKKMPGTSFAVDAFGYGQIPNITGYFLTHFHSDHYFGLTSKFNYGTIYCTQITANLLKQQLRVKPEFIKVLPLNEFCTVEGGVEVYMIDANHCPGSALILFRIPMPRPQKPLLILHTGDFRANKTLHIENEVIKQVGPLDIIYLDTTYCNPRYRLPDQSLVLSRVGELCARLYRENKQILFLVGTYLIGKERVLIEISRQCEGAKIYADQRKTKILQCLENAYLNERMTSNSKEARCHFIQIGKLEMEWLKEYLDTHSDMFDYALAFRPTGWAHSNNPSKQLLPKWLASHSNSINDPLKLSSVSSCQRIVLLSVSYSEHSSFTELEAFVKGVNSKRIIPTVNIASEKSRNEMQKHFAAWKRAPSTRT